MQKFNMIVMWLLLALALSSCATRAKVIPPAPPQVIEVPAPKLAPAPATVMVERKPDFRERLLNFFSPSPTTPTTLPASSPPPSK